MAKTKPTDAAKALAARRIDRKPWDQLSGDNILEHLDRMHNAQDALRWYFRLKSEFWRALRRHVGESAPGKCCVLNKRWPCISRRGTGWDISLKDSFTYVDPNAETYVIEFEACFEIDDDDHDDHGKTINKHCRVDVPKDLELNFTKRKFDAWLRQQKKLLEAQDEDELQDQITKLVARYPEAKKLLKGTK